MWLSYFYINIIAFFLNIISGIGNYDINVLEKALMNENLEVQWFDVRKGISTRKIINFLSIYL